RRAHGLQHAARNDGTHGGLYGPADHLGPGAELAGAYFPRQTAVERHTRRAAHGASRRHPASLRKVIRVCSRWFAAFSFLCAAISGARAAGVDFEGQIAPILITSCVPCHGGSKVMGGLRLTTRVGASKVV